ncbi:unnamed protein product [Caenorhabditis nigoni]
MRFNYHRKALEVKNSLETTKQMLVDFLKSFIVEEDADRKRTTDSIDSSKVEEETMNFWDWLNTDEAEELIWNISCPDHPDKQKERMGSAKRAEEKKAWMKNEEKKKNKKDKKEK